MIQCEKWQEPQYAKYVFNLEDVKIIKNAISCMKSSVNRLEQDFTKQDSFKNGLTFNEIVKLHNSLSIFFTVNCDLLERVSDAEHELSNFINIQNLCL